MKRKKALLDRFGAVRGQSVSPSSIGGCGVKSKEGLTGAVARHICECNGVGGGDAAPTKSQIHAHGRGRRRRRRARGVCAAL